MLPIIPIIAAAASASVLIHRKIKSKRKKDSHAKLIAYAKEKNIHVDEEGNFNPNAQLPNGTPLLFDVMSNVELFTSLLDYAADPNICDDRGVPAICHASAMENPYIIVSSLLKHGANPNAMDSEGKTAIFYANRREILKMLCDAGADINARESNGKTALFYCLDDYMKVISLIKLGTDINAKDIEGKNILFYIPKRTKHFFLIAFLEQNGLIIDTADDDKINFTEYELYQQFKTNLSSNIEPSLQAAVANNNILEVLHHISKGADPKIKHSSVKTWNMIYLAVNRKSPEIIEILANSGADIDNQGGDSPLQTAVDNVDITCIKKLLELGADPNVKDSAVKTWNMIYLAVYKKSPQMIEILAKAGADIDNRGGISPLEKAVDNKDIACIKKLLELGADPEPVRDSVKFSENLEIKQIFKQYDKDYID